jgi:hypothetical protein
MGCQGKIVLCAESGIRLCAVATGTTLHKGDGTRRWANHEF